MGFDGRGKGSCCSRCSGGPLRAHTEITVHSIGPTEKMKRPPETHQRLGYKDAAGFSSALRGVWAQETMITLATKWGTAVSSKGGKRLELTGRTRMGSLLVFGKTLRRGRSPASEEVGGCWTVNLRKEFPARLTESRHVFYRKKRRLATKGRGPKTRLHTGTH